MSHKLIYTTKVSPDNPAPGHSVLIQVLDKDGRAYQESDSIIITIDGHVGSHRYLQFARPGRRLIRVTAAADGVIDTAMAEINVQPIARIQERINDTDKGSISPFSHETQIAKLPLLHAATTYSNPYSVSFAVSGYTMFKRGLARRKASVHRLESWAEPPPAATYSVADKKRRFDGFSVISGVTGTPTGKLPTDLLLQRTVQQQIGGFQDLTLVQDQVKTGSYLDDEISQKLTKYHWDFGDGHVETTNSLRVEHDYSATLDPTKSYQLFDVSLCIQRPNGDTEEVKRTLTIHNAYAICKQHGVIEPPIEHVEFADVAGLGFSARLRVHNVEQYPLVLVQCRFRALAADLGEDNILGDLSVLDPPIVIPAASVKEIPVFVPFTQVPRRSSGFTVYYFGTSDERHRIRIEATFDIRLADRDSNALTVGNGIAIGKLPECKQLDSDHVMTSPTGIAALEDTLIAETVKQMVHSSGAEVELTGQKAQSILMHTPISPAPPQEDMLCDPDNLPNLSPDQKAAGWTCQATSETREVQVPARFMNALKGDIVLDPGSGLIGGLLRQVVPPQRYSHTGIMTHNFDQITHATASESRLLDHPKVAIKGKPQPTDGFEPNALKYLWPGVITQSVEDAIFGEKMVDPDTGKSYTISSFSPGAVGADVAGVWEIIPPLVLKPDPQLETTEIRKKLHRVADEAVEQTGKSHYRLYCYTDPTIWQQLKGVAPDTAGWAAGTYPSVCSSFIWMMLKRHGIKIEGDKPITQPHELEIADVMAGAQVKNTPDGLYLYTAAERQAGAEWLKVELTYMVEQVLEDEAGAFGGLIDFFTDIADDVSNQMLNTFASDWSDKDAKDSEAWRKMEDANAVSPDNLLFWDGPPSGLYGYAVPLVYRSPRLERVTVHRWKQELKQGRLTGHVYYNGQPVKHVLVQLYDGKTTYSNGGGAYTLEEIPLGKYELKAYKSALADSMEGSDLVYITIREGVQTVDLYLEPPADYYRRVEIDVTIDTTDDETWPFSDEHATDRYHKDLFVGPWGTHAETVFEQRMGGEIRVELYFDVDLHRDRSVTVTTTAKLYEGATESTDDLEDEKTAIFLVEKGKNVKQTIELRNTGAGGGDKSDISIKVVNRREN